MHQINRIFFALTTLSANHIWLISLTSIFSCEKVQQLECRALNRGQWLQSTNAASVLYSVWIRLWSYFEVSKLRFCFSSPPYQVVRSLQKRRYDRSFQRRLWNKTSIVSRRRGRRRRRRGRRRRRYGQVVPIRVIVAESRVVCQHGLITCAILTLQFVAVQEILGLSSDFSPHIVLISIFTSQMALLGFFCESSLLPPLWWVLKHAKACDTSIVKERLHTVERERRREGRIRKKANWKNTLPRRDWNPVTLSPEPSALTTAPCHLSVDFLN